MTDSLLMEFHERIQSGRCLTNKQQNTMMLNFLRPFLYFSFRNTNPIAKANTCYHKIFYSSSLSSLLV